MKPRDSRTVALSSIAVLAVTTIHHAYGAHVYRTPWRLHAAAVAALLVPFILGTRSAFDRAPSRKTLALFALTAGVVPLLGFGAFEGAYNHVLKNALFFGHAPPSVMKALFPPPTYEMPNDALFELTGMAHVVPAVFGAVALVRLCWPRGAMHEASRSTHPTNAQAAP